MNGLKKFFEGIWAKLKPGAEQAIEDFEQKITPEVLTLAQDSIQFVAAEGLGGNEARDAAIEKLKTDAEAAGVSIEGFAKSELNALIELVYVAVKPTAPPASETEAKPAANVGEVA